SLKRSRDNRPTEKDIHCSTVIPDSQTSKTDFVLSADYTMNKLLSAQHYEHNQRKLAAAASQSPFPFSQPALSSLPVELRQTHVHPFFSAFSRQQKTMTGICEVQRPVLTCDDCDARLPALWDDEEGCLFRCEGIGCGKRVCEIC